MSSILKTDNLRCGNVKISVNDGSTLFLVKYQVKWKVEMSTQWCLVVQLK